jgi:hypothetical protein
MPFCSMEMTTTVSEDTAAKFTLPIAHHNLGAKLADSKGLQEHGVRMRVQDAALNEEELVFRFQVEAHPPKGVPQVGVSLGSTWKISWRTRNLRHPSIWDRNIGSHSP